MASGCGNLRSKTTARVPELHSSTVRMRVAVCGTNGLARLISHYINQDTGHHVVLLSRTQQSRLSQTFQIAVVDYTDQQSLQFALRGIDTVISTVTGPNQIELMKAAVSVRVRRFAPAEFEGRPQNRAPNDPLDRGKTAARQWLAQHAQSIETTSFVCGLFYERFQPGGLSVIRMSVGSGFEGEGDYIMNCRTMEAEVPCYDNDTDAPVTICLTTAVDVAKYVTKALDLPQWPSELRMCGHRTTVRDLVHSIETLKGQHFDPVQWHDVESLQSALRLAILRADRPKQIKLLTLLATAEGRYDFTQSNLPQMFPQVRQAPFQEWFIAKWRHQT